MSDMTPEKAQALLDGATPGPWLANGEPWNLIVWSAADNRVCFMAHSNGLDDERDVATAELVAAAPDLARAYIAQAAEITRLRAQVEGLTKERGAACKAADGYKDDFHEALGSDGRPCNTDVFLAAAIRSFSDKWDLYEAAKDWVEGDWEGALAGIDRAALATYQQKREGGE